MVNKIVKYVMHMNNDKNLVTPYFIMNGGHFLVNHEMVGVTEDDDKVYVPTTLEELSEQQFIDFVVSLSLKDEEGNEMTSEQKTSLANSWLDNNFRNL